MIISLKKKSCFYSSSILMSMYYKPKRLFFRQFYCSLILINLGLHWAQLDVFCRDHLPLLQRDPVHPGSHPLPHWPVTWSHVVPSLQCLEHCWLQLTPYHLSGHSGFKKHNQSTKVLMGVDFFGYFIIFFN